MHDVHVLVRLRSRETRDPHFAVENHIHNTTDLMDWGLLFLIVGHFQFSLVAI